AETRRPDTVLAAFTAEDNSAVSPLGRRSRRGLGGLGVFAALAALLLLGFGRAHERDAQGNQSGQCRDRYTHRLIPFLAVFAGRSSIERSAWPAAGRGHRDA